MIGSVSKAYGWSIEEIIWERSWENVIMYSAVLPSFDSSDSADEVEEDRQVIDMDNHPDEEKLRELFKKLG